MSRFKLSGLAKLAKGFGARVPMSKARTTQAAANFRKRAKAKRNANKNRSANFAGRYPDNPTAKQRRLEKAISKKGKNIPVEYDPEFGEYITVGTDKSSYGQYKDESFSNLLAAGNQLLRRRYASGRNKLNKLSRSPNKKKIARALENARISRMKGDSDRYKSEMRRTGIPF